MRHVYCLLMLIACAMTASSAFAQPATPAATAAASGLVADGKTDVTDALQAALERDHILRLPAGKYRITKPLRLGAGMGIVGEGTLVVDFDSGKPDATNIALLCGGNDIRIEGITIAKNFIDGSYGVGIQLVGTGYRGMRISNVEISGYSARYGIHLQECEDFQISNCYIHDFMMNADGDMISDSPAGIRVTRSRNGVISDNRVERIQVGEHGMVSISPLVPKYGPQSYQSDCMTVMQCRNVTMVGNTLITSGEGIDVLLSQECTIAGNVIHDIWFQGIKMLGVSFTAITGNMIRGCHQGIGLAEHGTFKADCNGNTIAGNTILDSGAIGSFGKPGAERLKVASLPPAGINIGGTSDYTAITGNVILDTQATKTMQHTIRRNEAKHNVIANNVEDAAYNRPAVGWETPKFMLE